MIRRKINELLVVRPSDRDGCFRCDNAEVSNGFARWLPIIGVIVGYGIAFWLMAQALNFLPLGFVYATWSGVGTVLTVLAGMWLFKEKMNRQAWIGMGILIAGIVLLNAA
ncbi:multidrug efflux SMR transporter [Paenibacillus sp. D2_2]|uniref:DMT family transporter n=1 Tax=Paenibacillus sp. D2_2 TaxID=3073092 RepID=UPI002814FA0D|nr:multidrug efflux SMR transporter [Paenibacillus sp. D2_2]WMT42941.1 multidrug efflux SMR transporter [Paenibacillus sp. D2_2]